MDNMFQANICSVFSYLHDAETIVTKKHTKMCMQLSASDSVCMANAAASIFEELGSGSDGKVLEPVTL